MKNENNVYNNIYCPNCKTKISPGNTFCSYCGNIIANVISNNNLINNNNVIDSNKIEYTDLKTNIINNVGNNLNIKSVNLNDGKGVSNISFLLFCFIFLPYLIGTIYAFSIPSNSDSADGRGFFVVFGGFFILIPTLISFILGVVAIAKYKRYNGEKEKNRKIFNILNIISLIIMTPFILICGILICMIIFAPVLFPWMFN